MAVLEIAENAFDDPDYVARFGPVSLYPYIVVVQLAFNTTVVFADSVPDLARLLGEVLPLVGGSSQPPSRLNMYQLHEWTRSADAPPPA